MYDRPCLENDEGEFLMSKCYRNMSAVAASLVVQALRQGIVVERVRIYGIVAIISQIDKCKLVQLQIDFNDDSVRFFKSFGSYQFDLLLNAVLSELDI